MRWRAALIGQLAVATVSTSALAQFRPAPNITGSVRGGYWSSTRDLDSRAPIGAAMLWAKGSAPISERTTLIAEGWAALRGPPESLKGAVELREAYVSIASRALDVRVGRQLLAWGRADGVNPTGNLAAEDLTLLTPDDADRRLGTTALVATYFFGGVALSALWLPEFRGHRIPLPPGGGSIVRDRVDWPGDQWAVRLDRTGGSLDWSLSIFQGRDLTPDVAPAGPADGAVLRHHRVRVLGADAATTVGWFGLRAEAAYVHTTDDGGLDPYVKNSFLFAIIGADRTFDGRLNVNVQYLLRHVLEFRRAPDDDPLAQQQSILSAQTRRAQHGVTMRASYNWLHETLEAEWAAVAYVEPRGIAMRPKVTYDLSDRVSVLAGAEVFRGASGSMFRLLRPNSVTYLEARWGF